jgi:hypothetical protein
MLVTHSMEEAEYSPTPNQATEPSDADAAGLDY